MRTNPTLSKTFQALPLEQQVEALTLLAPPTQKKQILVDISHTIASGIKTGIQRVVNQQLHHLQHLDQSEYEITPVYLKLIDDKHHFLYARNHQNPNILVDEPVTLTTNDILYSSDLSVKTVQEAKDANIYKLYKALGTKIIFLVHDILPITNPDYFPTNAKTIHTNWLNNIATISDTLIATTATGKKTLDNWLNQNHYTLKTSYLHLGSDIQTKPQPKNHHTNQTPSFLIVGTLEPRKGHAQLIKAFTLLLEQNINITLTIVGKVGWNIEETLTLLNTNPYLNKNIFYKNIISDEELQHLYTSSDALLIPSNAEGFGLPLIEAAHYNLPIIARDIEVFKEIATTNAHYFPNTQSPTDLATSIKEWLTLQKTNTHPKPKGIKTQTWNQHSKKLLELIVNSE